MPKVPYYYEANGKLVTGNGSLIPICSLSNCSLLPSLTVHANWVEIKQQTNCLKGLELSLIIHHIDFHLSKRFSDFFWNSYSWHQNKFFFVNIDFSLNHLLVCFRRVEISSFRRVENQLKSNAEEDDSNYTRWMAKPPTQRWGSE